MYPLATASSPCLCRKENMNLSTMASQKVYGNAPFFFYLGWHAAGRERESSPPGGCCLQVELSSPISFWSIKRSQSIRRGRVERHLQVVVDVLFYDQQLLSQILQKVTVFFAPLVATDILYHPHHNLLRTWVTGCTENLLSSNECAPSTSFFFGLQWSINLC